VGCCNFINLSFDEGVVHFPETAEGLFVYLAPLTVDAA